MKKGKPQSRRVVSITDYEKQRLNTLKLNASRMEAMGLRSLANKSILSQIDSTAKRIVEEEDIVSEEMDSEDMLNEDRDYQPYLEEDGNADEMDLVPNLALAGKDLKNKEKDLQAKEAVELRKREQASRNEIISSTRGERLPLQQTVSMAEFAKARNRKQLVQHQQEQPMQKVPQNIQHQPRVQPAEHNKNSQKQLPRHLDLQQVPSQHNSKLQPQKLQQQSTQQVLENKKMLQEQRLKRKKLHRDQCCSPGSLNVYRNLRQKQLEKSAGHLSSVELPTTTLVQDETHESILNFTQQDQSMQGSPSRTVLPENLVDDQNEMGLECNVENQGSTSRVAEKKKHRGPTLMVKVHQRTFQECQPIVLNAKGQPIGPPSLVTELAGFLGTIAKDPTLVPINILDWKCMPTKEDIWSYVKEKYNISEHGKKYVLETVNDDWRVYKSRLKTKHYKAYATDEERWNNRPSTIPENQFRELLDYWDSSVGKEIARVNATNRQKHEDVHTMGPHSITRLRHELEQKNTNKEHPSDSMVYKLSRKRDPTRAYKTNGYKTKENIEKMNDIQVQIESGEKGNNLDPYSEVISKEHSGRAFLQGRGLKISTLKGKDKKGGYILDKDFFQNMKEEWAEELIPTLASQILSQLKVANPYMNLVIPDFTSTPKFSNQVIEETNLHNDVEIHPSPQNEDVEDVEDDN